MKQLITKFLLVMAIGFAFNQLSLSDASAQLFGKKMPVGTKVYSVSMEKYDDEIGAEIKYEIQFQDISGELEKYNFKSLDTSIKTETRVIVFDTKDKIWRLPLSENEALGIAEKEGDEPLARRLILLGRVEEAMRQKIK